MSFSRKSVSSFIFQNCLHTESYKRFDIERVEATPDLLCPSHANLFHLSSFRTVCTPNHTNDSISRGLKPRLISYVLLTQICFIFHLSELFAHRIIQTIRYREG